MNSPGRASEICANFDSGALSRNAKAVLSIFTVVVNFYHTGKRLCLGEFV